MLTWYGKQGLNNPFSPQSSIFVYGNNKNCTFIHKQKKIRQNTATVLIPSLWSDCLPLKHLLPENWHCISKKAIINKNCFSTVPKSWKVFDTCISIPNEKSHWPAPIPYLKNETDDMKIKRVFPFNDNRAVRLITISSVKILLIDGLYCVCSKSDVTKFHEKIELLILINATDTLSLNCRSVFRPRFMVASGDNLHHFPDYSNLLICSSTQPQHFDFKISRHGIIALM